MFGGMTLRYLIVNVFLVGSAHIVFAEDMLRTSICLESSRCFTNMAHCGGNL